MIYRNIRNCVLQSLKLPLYIVILFISCSSSLPEDGGPFLPGDYLPIPKPENFQYKDVLGKAPGAGFLSGRYAEVHLADTYDPVQFYLASLEYEISPYNVESAHRLLFLLPGLDNPELVQKITTGLRAYPERNFEIDRLLTKWYYEQEDDDQLIPMLKLLSEAYPQSSSDGEILLWNIVAEIRGNSGFPHEKIQTFNTQFRASDLHWRLDRYIQFRPDLLLQMDELNVYLLQQKAAISQQQFKGSVSDLFSKIDGSINELLLWDMYTAAVQIPNRPGSAVFFQDFAGKTNNSTLKITSQELAGRLFALGGRHNEAIEVFHGTLALIRSEGVQARRIIWNSLRSGIQLGQNTAITQIRLLADQMFYPPYYDDLLHDFISQLIRSESWNHLAELYTVLDKVMSESMKARLSWILAELHRLQLIENDLPTRNELLETAALQEQDPYYQLVAQIALGGEPSLPLLSPDTLQTPENPTGEQEKKLAWAEQLYRADLPEDGYNFVLNNTQSIPEHRIIRYAQIHHKNGQYINGLRLIERWMRVNQSRENPMEVSLLRYPLAFEPEMTEVLTRFELNPAVFYGLVREESYFDPTIGSHVGALGLAQLMPATANDMIQLLRLRDVDLTDPLTNLTIGSYYYRRLLNRFEVPLQALVAYNAGQGRVNSWRTEPWTRSSVLFHEGLPFEETRHYIRKIFVSAGNYQSLYFEGNPGDIFKHVFPDMDL